ncbi:DUF535 family protein [Bradyrhizobium sp. WYCCWR 13023]|uniref:DUF535 family protein n=1 Tax=Bradyrhizobium zhengyangense TaxID=2911009 RepID=A0A9X1RJU3_9BRAD|nr:DUF535 family protein [Bradyrhizobium zhengyangense]MCG2633020.1 DUF535 family protein [Bradyrhizobium zhengyangense]
MNRFAKRSHLLLRVAKIENLPSSFRVQTLTHYWRRVRRTPLAKAASAGLSMLRHARLLLPFMAARPGTRLNAYLRARPEILEMVHGPYLAADWDAATKIGRVIDHLETVSEIAGIVDMPPDTVVDLIDPHAIGFGYRITLDQARWLLREGQLVLSLWDGIDRIFSLSFSLSTQGGRRVAYIGGIQGRHQVAGEPDILDRYRLFTKAAYGSRPRDFLVEVFRLFCKAIGVTEIFAVADANHPTRNDKNAVGISYDEIWQERGAVYNNDGFYHLPVTLERRSEEEIPAKKRSLYRKRFALFDSIEEDLKAHFHNGRVAGSKPAVPEVHPREIVTTFDATLRTLAYAGSLLVLSIDKILGGSWLGFAIGAMLVQFTYWLLNDNISRGTANRIMAIRQVRGWPTAIRALLAALIVGADIAIDVIWGGHSLGRTFNLYLLPMFLTSLFLGGRVALTVSLFCFLAVYYLDIPPRYSFALTSIESAAHLVVFIILAAIVLVVPKLLFAAAELAAAKK